ncbi:MAG: site-2 protease family protein [Pseudanabaenaceae cyanobacterium bins.68]|nr:site-2 protease family protein [Pseudanabaenaceae cyanobacterium bins.68]
MKGGIRVGTVFGIPLFLDRWWLFILVLFSWDFARGYIALSPNFYLLFGLISALLLFGSILCHELAHSWVAIRHGVAVESIALHPLRAITNMTQEGSTPRAVLAIAIAGPISNFCLCGLLILAAWAIAGGQIFSVSRGESLVNLATGIGAARSLLAYMAWELAQVNLGLGLLNSLPGLPLDGGHVLKAIIWRLSGDRFTGIRGAAWSGQVLGWLTLFGGGFLLSRGGSAGLILLLVGLFLLSSAGGSLQVANIQQALLSLTAEAVMTREFRLLDTTMSLRQFADEYLLLANAEQHQVFYGVANGRDRGLIRPERLKEIDRSQWISETVQVLVQPIGELTSVELRDDLAKVIDLLETQELRHITVLSQVGAVAGLIDRGDIIRALARKLQWRVPDPFIQQVKHDGRFPPNFPLWELSRSLLADKTRACAKLER